MCVTQKIINLTRMWADVQRDGRPTECRWRPLRKFRNMEFALLVASKLRTKFEMHVFIRSKNKLKRSRNLEDLIPEVLRNESFGYLPGPVPRCKVWLTPTGRVRCSNAANTGERKTWTQSEFCTWQNSVRGSKSTRKCYQPRRRTNIVQSLVGLR